LELQNELVDSQDKIMSDQRFYNGNVRDFNTKLQVFPTNLYAQSLGFKPYGFIEAGENEKGNVNVEF
jgi:LemA protein